MFHRVGENFLFHYILVLYTLYILYTLYNLNYIRIVFIFDTY